MPLVILYSENFLNSMDFSYIILILKNTYTKWEH